MLEPQLSELLELRRAKREAGRAARYPDEIALKAAQMSPVTRQPFPQPAQLVQNHFYFFVIACMNLDPVDAILVSIGMPVPDGKIPPMCIRLMRLKRAIDIRTALQQTGIFRSHMWSVLTSKRT